LCTEIAKTKPPYLYAWWLIDVIASPNEMNWTEPLTLVQLDGLKAASLIGTSVNILRLTVARTVVSKFGTLATC
jgi:hypothetical protein